MSQKSAVSVTGVKILLILFFAFHAHPGFAVHHPRGLLSAQHEQMSLHTKLQLVHPRTDGHAVNHDEHPHQHSAMRYREKPTPNDEAPKHKVEHVGLLNENKFWWLMGTLIFAIAVVIVRVEMRENTASEKTLDERKQSSESNRHNETLEGTMGEFCLCFVGLNVCMLLWGISQEFVMTNYYTDGNGLGELIPSALFVVLCNRAGSIVFLLLLAFSTGQPLYPETNQAVLLSSLPALSNLAASWSQYASLAFVSFPLQTTAKSAKVLPVVLLGAVRGKKQTFLDFAEAIAITLAVVIFGLEDGDTTDMHFEAQGPGGVLLCIMMFCDSVTPHLQDLLFQTYPKTTVIQSNFSMATVASLLCLLVLTLQSKLVDCFIFLSHHHDAILHLAVLAICSTLVQFLISYTVKLFGPVVFILIVTARQIISVCLSSFLFNHQLSVLAVCAAMMVFGTMLFRAFRRANLSAISERANFKEQAPRIWQQLLILAIAIHIPLCFWAVAQEFIATHSFGGQIFHYSLFLIAMNRTVGVLFALLVIYCRQLPIYVPASKLSALPASANFIATFCQYDALYYIRFPEQTLLKTLKVIPVMLLGRVLNNRRYQWSDYMEAAFLTGLVAFFVYDFTSHNKDLNGVQGNFIGVMFMVAYLLVDSLTPNFEDYVYQTCSLDPAHMMLGNDLICAVLSWICVFISGQASPAVSFLVDHGRDCGMHLALLSSASACGCYACMLTVSRFGPAIFTLLMMSRQVISLVISVVLFQHEVDFVSCLCLIVVSITILTSSLRKAHAQASYERGDEDAHPNTDPEKFVTLHPDVEDHLKLNPIREHEQPKA